MMDQTFLTPEGLKKLEEELIFLRTVRRAQVAERLHNAQEDGELIENAEYEDAKQEQSFLEGRIATIEVQIRNAEIISHPNGDKVRVGSTVVLSSADGKETYTIVGSAEASPRDGRISNESPVGAALMGRKKGDVVTVTAPAGAIDYTLVSIK